MRRLIEGGAYLKLGRYKEIFSFKAYITYKKFRTKKVSEIFKRPKNLRYRKTTLVSRNKTKELRKGLEMAGIVKAATKELEPESSF